MIICITFLCCVKCLTSLPVSGSSSAVERQLPKLDVAGSIPVSRSIFPSIYGLTSNLTQQILSA
jgi:hypothetical protein